MKKFRPLLRARDKSFIMMLDFLVLLLTIPAVSYLRLGFVPYIYFTSISLWFVIFIVISASYLSGAYDLDANSHPIKIFLTTSLSVATGLLLVILVNYLLQQDRGGFYGRGILLGSLLLYLSLSLFYRYLIWKWFRKFSQKIETLFVVSLDYYYPIMKDLERCGFQGKSFFLLDEIPSDLKNNSSILGTWKGIESSLERRWTSIVVGIKKEDQFVSFSTLLMEARFAGFNIVDLFSFYEGAWYKMPVFYLGPQWFILGEGFNLIANPMGLRLKRLIDLILAITILLMTWPIMILVALAIYFEVGAPIFYRQVRTGKNEMDFTIYKFRSMMNDAEKNGAQWADQNDQRVTRIGYYLRKLRLDELPQLFNVIKGEMSFVGPRPERPEFNLWLEKEIPFYHLRHLVRPGITGWAQIMYSYGACKDDAQEKLQYDLFYIKNYSPFLDIQIVLKTISIICLGRGR